MQLRLYGKGPFFSWSWRCFSLCGCVLQEKPWKFICNIFAPFNLGHNSAFSCSNLATFSVLLTIQVQSHQSKSSIKCCIYICHFWEAQKYVLFLETVHWPHMNKGEKGTHLIHRHWNWSLREPGNVCRCSVVTAHTASIFSWMGAIYKVPTDKTSSKDTLNTFPSFSISAFYVPTK